MLKCKYYLYDLFDNLITFILFLMLGLMIYSFITDNSIPLFVPQILYWGIYIFRNLTRVRINNIDMKITRDKCFHIPVIDVGVRLSVYNTLSYDWVKIYNDLTKLDKFLYRCFYINGNKKSIFYRRCS